VTQGVLLGLAAALCWGLTDLIAAIAARRVGTLRAAAASLSTSLVVLGSLLVASGPTLPLEVADVLRIGAMGALAALSTLSLWSGLRRGPMTVVSPVAASTGAATVVLAWLVLGEEPRPLQWLAVPAAAVGCMLASTSSVAGRRLSIVGRGPLFALVAVAGFAVVAIGLREPIDNVGWLLTIVVARIVNTAVVWIVLGASVGWGARTSPAGPPDAVPDVPAAAAVPGAPSAWSGWRFRLLLLASGVFDAIGFSAFALGFQVAPVWLIGLLSSFAPVIGVLGGLLLFGERPARRQKAGAVAIGLAVVFVAIG
jgi:drug/metabolite transporter (DMT)-like permease